MSSNPILNPALENGRQGKSAHKMSKSGMFFMFILVISPDGISPKLAK